MLQAGNVRRVYFGWFHRESVDLPAVQVKNAQGTSCSRVVDFDSDCELNYNTILERAKKMYYKDGESIKGSASDMVFELCTFGAEKMIEQFTDIDGNECTFDVFLRSNGLFPCKYVLYLLSTRKDAPTSRTILPRIIVPDSSSSSVIPMHVEETVSTDSGNVRKNEEDPQGPDVTITYRREKISNYIRQPSFLYCTTRQVCHDMSSTEDPELRNVPVNKCDPFDCGFEVARIEIDGKVYMEINDEGNHYPLASPLGDSYIVHGPQDIWGYECGAMILGILTKKAFSEEVYVWKKNGATLDQHPQANVIYVDSKGTYEVAVHADGNIYKCEAVDVHADGKVYKCEGVAVGVHQGTIQTGAHGSKMRRATVNDNNCTTDALLSIGDLQYSATEILGKGAYGTVYRGEYAGTTVAIKKLKMRMITAKRYVNQEVAIHKRLLHPNIVLFIGAAFGKGSLLIVTEYINGPNLEQIIFDEDISSTYGDITFPSKLQIACQAVQGLSYLHGRKPVIIHCDLKPANILLTRNFDTVKICDMGISKARAQDQTITTAAKDVLPGTPTYLAPEVLLHNAKTSTDTDMWSLGCTYAELFTLKECWAQYDVLNASGAERDSDDGSIETLKTYMQDRLSPCVMQALEKNDVVEEILSLCLSYEPKKRLCALEVALRLKRIDMK